MYDGLFKLLVWFGLWLRC